MAKLSSINKNNKRIKLSDKYFSKRKKLKDIIMNKGIENISCKLYIKKKADNKNRKCNPNIIIIFSTLSLWLKYLFIVTK